MSINNWIINEIFPNINNGFYLEIIKHEVNTKEITSNRFLKLGWNININYIFPRLMTHNIATTSTVNPIKHYYNELKTSKALEKFFKKIEITNNFIHVFVAHTSKIYPLFNNLNLRKFRFGVIILKGSDNVKHIRDRYTAKNILKDNYYYFYQNINGYDCFVSSVGSAPYYLGQPVMNKYYITGNFKSGCGSTGVFMIRDQKQTRYVLKIASSNLTYEREVDALTKTKSWQYSPNLIDSDSKRLYIITNWCGRDFKRKPKKDKLAIRSEVQKLCDILTKHYKIYHNDIRWKNITYNGKYLILIDWGMSDDENNEKNHDHILREDQTMCLQDITLS